MNRKTATIGIMVCGFLLISTPILASQGGGSISGGPKADQKAYTPEKGSVERKAIMDSLRVPVEKKLKQAVIFKIDHLKVQNGWAFMQGVPRTPEGKAIDYKETIYQDALEAGAFDDSVVALLHNVNGKWRVVQYVIGATDVPYADWDTRYRAPKPIFSH